MLCTGKVTNNEHLKSVSTDDIILCVYVLQNKGISYSLFLSLYVTVIP